MSGLTEETKVIITALMAFGVAVLAAFALTPLVKRLAVYIGAVDVPKDERRMHKHPIPRLGGLAIFLGFTVSALMFCDLTDELRGILLGAVVIVALGVVDDIKRLPALVKLAVQLCAALIPVLHGTVIDFISNPALWSSDAYIELGVFSAPVTVLWIVLITNAVNLIDGLDGLAVGVSLISSFSLLIIALVIMDEGVLMIMAAVAGACVGFMPFNFNPAKMFMGDTGAMFLGFILAVVSVQGLFKFYAVISFAVPFLILGLPIFDTIFAIIRRISKGKNPMSPDRSHVHHHLIDMGFSQKQAVAILYTMSGFLGILALVMTLSGELRAMLLILAIFAAAAIGAKVMTTSASKRNGNGEDADIPPPESGGAIEGNADIDENPVNNDENDETCNNMLETDGIADDGAENENEENIK